MMLVCRIGVLKRHVQVCTMWYIAGNNGNGRYHHDPASSSISFCHLLLISAYIYSSVSLPPLSWLSLTMLRCYFSNY